MKKSELVFIPAPAIGHLASMIELGKRLIDRDDRLSITILTMKGSIGSTINAYIESVSAASITGIRFLDLPPLDPPKLQNPTPETFVSLFIEKYKPHIKHTITQLISSASNSNSVRLTGLVIDLFFTTIIDVGNELGVPTYLYFSSTAAMLGLMLHLPTLHTQITTEFMDSETDLIIPSFINPVPPSVLPTPLMNKKDEAYTWFVYHGRRFRETKGMIVNTFSELEPFALNSFSDNRTPPVYAVGPLLDLQGQTQTQTQTQTQLQSDSDRVRYDKIMKWLDDQPPSSVILLCFGSMGSFDVPQIKEIALGIERSGHRFLWSLRQPTKIGLNQPSDVANPEEVLPDGFLERMDGRGLVCGWIPQVELLAHQAIGGFVSHCGWNSVLESLWFGVPIVTWPLYAEQHLNAFEMVRELGMAVEMRLDYRKGRDMVMADEVERGVRCVMDDDSDLRRRVKEMGEKSRIAMMDGGSSFASLGHLIEDLVDKN